MQDIANNFSDQFLESFNSFVESVIRRIVETKEHDSAFTLAEWLATLLWDNFSGIYRLDKLEIALIERIIEGDYSLPKNTNWRQETELHVATELYQFGGHTQLMSQLIKNASCSVQVLLTKESDLNVTTDILGISAESITIPMRTGNAIQRVIELAACIVSYPRIFLHLHPNDIYGAVAVRLAKSLRPDIQVCFVNHADHVFSVAIGVADVVFEVSAYGWILRGARSIEDRSSFIGIPLAPSLLSCVQNDQANGIHVISGGAAYKYKPIGGFSIHGALDKLLQSHLNMSLTVLGPDENSPGWKMLRDKYGSRVQIRKAVPRDEYRQALARCALYIDSYPLSGGTAMPEALLSGLKVVGIRGIVWGYSATDQLLADDVESFLGQCDALLRSDRSALVQQAKVREACSRLHAAGLVRSRVNSFLDSGHPVLPPSEQMLVPPKRNLEHYWKMRGSVSLPKSRLNNASRLDRRWLGWALLKHNFGSKVSCIKLIKYGVLYK